MQQEPGKPVQPVKTMGPVKFFVIIGAGLVVLCLVATLARPDTSPSEQAATEGSASLLRAPENWVTVTPEPTATPPPGVGDAVVLEGVTLKVVTAENTGQEFKTAERTAPLTTTGQFILITVEVTNTGKEPIALHTPKLIDSAGREFNRHEDQFWYLPDNRRCALETLNPGLSRTCSDLFELPADATGIAAVLKTSLFGDGVRVNLSP